MAVLLASLGIVLSVLNRPAPKPAATAALPDMEYIIDLRGDEYQGLASVTIKNDTGEYTIIPGDPPSIPGYEPYITNTYPLSRIISVSSGLISFDLIAEEAENLAAFGLDVPRAEIRIKPVRGDELALYIGNPAPDGMSAYVKKGGSPAVHLSSLWDTDTYLQGVFDFIDTELSPAATGDGTGGYSFDRITLGGAVRQGEEVTIFVRENDEEDPLGQQRTMLRISGPIDARLNLDRGYPIIESVFGLSASRAAAKINSNSDLAKFGLDKPWSTVAVSGTMGQGLGGFGLRVSKPDAAGKVYVQREGLDLVYEADASQFPWLETSWFTLMDGLIIYPFIDLLSSVEVRTPARTVSFSLSGVEDDLKVKALDLDIDTANFRSYYQTLLTARYDEVSAEKPAPGAKPVLEIIYNYRSGKQADTVSFYSTATRRVLTSFNGSRPFYTFAGYVDKVIADLDQTLAGKRVLPYI